MNNNLAPSEQDILSAVSSMTGERVLSLTRMATGDQNFVFAIHTAGSEYVLRMTDISHKHKFYAAMKWQKMLLPLGVPLAEFINSDLEARYSPFPALLMLRLPGDDLINVYPQLADLDKRNLADEMINIQALCNSLPKGPGYGILDSYDDPAIYGSWYEFLVKKLEFCKKQITNTAIFNPAFATQVLNIARDLKDKFNTIQPKPFLWDASERNVLVHNGKISGIVDVDELCFGDPLLVIALTSTCLELDGFDTKYTDYWASELAIDESAQARLNFYRLFYAVAFMRKHAMQTANRKKLMLDKETLLRIFNNSLQRMNY
ncbi:aminoglycoside phosphotransferase family protein [Legionella spiritensis]|uniref:aminoglycoside phosphotransferase family protein n=1 Tax=Legionella spiritensis TaxID=452 RepID=UPI000F6D3905|nr:aminoglycoside phosphotransferase family protein [Legionella spiritensis]VEG92256.1 Phosphotransferase enzyme family [Legionella spiritensis]